MLKRIYLGFTGISRTTDDSSSSRVLALLVPAVAANPTARVHCDDPEFCHDPETAASTVTAVVRSPTPQRLKKVQFLINKFPNIFMCGQDLLIEVSPSGLKHTIPGIANLLVIIKFCINKSRAIEFNISWLHHKNCRN